MVINQMASVPSQVLYHIILNNIGPILASSVNSLYNSYLSSNKQKMQIIHTEIDDERELDLLQMDRLLKWMKLVFDESTPSAEEPLSPRSQTQREYRKELFNIFVTISTDYKEYQKRKTYNQSIWILSYYRSKDTKILSKKIISDIKLFKEGLQMYSMFDKI
jgi:hypothetical protein